MTLQKLRSYKIFDIAVFDLVISFIGIVLLFFISWKVHFKHQDIKKFIIAGIICTIPISITFHVLFGVNTALNYKLGLSNKV
jgi:hypothetical protein